MDRPKASATTAAGCRQVRRTGKRITPGGRANVLPIQSLTRLQLFDGNQSHDVVRRLIREVPGETHPATCAKEPRPRPRALACAGNIVVCQAGISAVAPEAAELPT